MKKKPIKLLTLLTSILMLSALSLYAEDIDSLLNTYAKNSDLSKKTKLENSGNRIIFTRDDLERMQVHSLKDVLKSQPLIRYQESRNNFPDILYNGGAFPFMSGGVRIFIDEQEMTNALYGSGFEYLGDIDLNFVDHIEIYSFTPTFEYSTEPTTLLIKLYSKVASRDMGGKFQAVLGSMGYNQESMYYTEELEDFSYMAYVNRLVDVRAKEQNQGATLNRDQERYHIFTKIYTKNQALQVQAIKNEKKMFIGMSPSATPTDARNDYHNLHVGYNANINKLSFQIAYDQGASEQNYADKNVLFPLDATTLAQSFNVHLRQKVFTTLLQQGYNYYDNDILVGAKYRYKHFEYPSMNITTTTGAVIPLSASDYSTQQIGTLFLEDRYSFAQNSVITFGAQYTHVENDHTIANQDLGFLRLGYTYTTNLWAFNTTGYSQKAPVEPYMYNPLFSDSQTTEIQPQHIQGFIQEIKFSNNRHNTRLFLTYNITDNAFSQNNKNQIINLTDTIYASGTYLEYTFNFDENNKLVSNINYSRLDNVKSSIDNTLQFYGGFVRMLNSYNDADFFSELIYGRDNEINRAFYDLSLGFKYRFGIDLALAVKGENLLDRAPQAQYYQIDPTTGAQGDNLSCAPIDRRFTFTVDYLF